MLQKFAMNEYHLDNVLRSRTHEMEHLHNNAIPSSIIRASNTQRDKSLCLGPKRGAKLLLHAGELSNSKKMSMGSSEDASVAMPDSLKTIRRNLDSYLSSSYDTQVRTKMRKSHDMILEAHFQEMCHVRRANNLHL